MRGIAVGSVKIDEVNEELGLQPMEILRMFRAKEERLALGESTKKFAVRRIYSIDKKHVVIFYVMKYNKHAYALFIYTKQNYSDEQNVIVLYKDKEQISRFDYRTEFNLENYNPFLYLFLHRSLPDKPQKPPNADIIIHMPHLKKSNLFMFSMLVKHYTGNRLNIVEEIYRERAKLDKE